MAALSLLLCCIVVLVSSAPEPKMFYELEQADLHFEQFIQEFNKTYSNETEKTKRFHIFKENLRKINQMNRNENELAEFGINNFSDMTNEEFVQIYGCTNLKPPKPCTPAPESHKSIEVPETFDWRTKNKVTKVKMQGACGSCWTFSTTGSVEGAYAIKYNELKEFSEQQLLDCILDNDGCGGGWMSDGLLYLKSQGVIQEGDYPYEGRQGDCRYNPAKIAAKVTECYSHNAKTEDELKQALVHYGPLAIAINAQDVHPYKGGILERCAGEHLNHAVLLVGYGIENEVPYWIIKNSWDTTFGEEGYFRVRRNINACSILNPNTVSPVIA